MSAVKAAFASPKAQCRAVQSWAKASHVDCAPAATASSTAAVSAPGSGSPSSTTRPTWPGNRTAYSDSTFDPSPRPRASSRSVPSALRSSSRSPAPRQLSIAVFAVSRSIPHCCPPLRAASSTPSRSPLAGSAESRSGRTSCGTHCTGPDCPVPRRSIPISENFSRNAGGSVAASRAAASEPGSPSMSLTTTSGIGPAPTLSSSSRTGMRRTSSGVASGTVSRAQSSCSESGTPGWPSRCRVSAPQSDQRTVGDCGVDNGGKGTGGALEDGAGFDGPSFSITAGRTDGPAVHPATALAASSAGNRRVERRRTGRILTSSQAGTEELGTPRVRPGLAGPGQLPAGDRVQVVAGGLVELVVAAGRRFTVRAPPHEPRVVPEPRRHAALGVLVGDLDDALGAQRDPLVLGRTPAGDPARDPLGLAGGLAAPRVVLSVGDQRREFLRQLTPFRHRERADRADVVQHARLVVEAEQERTDQLAGLAVDVPAQSREHAVGGAQVLVLEQNALAGRVRLVHRLADHTVQPGALDQLEPFPCGRRVGGRR